MGQVAAAAVDAKAAANLVAAHQRRYETFAALIAMIREQALREAPEEATDSAWAIGGIDIFLLLRSIQGWDAPHYEEWIRRTLVDRLLAPRN